MVKKSTFIIILFLFGLSLISSHLFATTRGIKVTAKQGQSLYLYKDYHAMVVGISNYEKWPKLPNAVNDAKEIASKLRKFGFEVKVVLDPTYQEMKTTLNEMVYRMGIEENRALLFYYAGHGETETLADKTKMGYIIPRDCPILKKDPMGFATHAISMRDIESVSLRIRSKHVMMLFDSCFSGSLFALVRAAPEDITEKSALPVRQYVTAGREDEQVPDKSMFKRCLLVGLEGDADLTGDGYITGSELGMYLSDKVVNYTHRRQHPQYGKLNNPNLDRGDFIFVPVSLEAKLKATQEKLRKEIEEKKALKEELNRLRAEMEQQAPLFKEQKAKQTEEKRLASIPRKGNKVTVPKVKLRDIPKEIYDSDVRKMIEWHNFFIKDQNERGDFLNDFIDNGDGTITDRATDLMWQRGGSPSALTSWKAEEYVSRLNNEVYLGYDDWRIPTLEELCSLLKQAVSEENLHIISLFKSRLKKCWSSDRYGDNPYHLCEFNLIVNFDEGKIDAAAIRTCGGGWSGEKHLADSCFVRVVRTIKR
jgi:uncharacterized caspase-like protein